VLRRLVAASVLLLVTSGKTQAQDGNELLKRCQSLQKFYEGNVAKSDIQAVLDTGFCNGYINGVLGAGAAYSPLANCCSASTAWSVDLELPPNQPYFCAPQPLKTSQAVAVLVEYLKSHSAVLHKGGHFLLIKAFHDAWPCSARP
jgi:hypothetical protein